MLIPAKVNPIKVRKVIEQMKRHWFVLLVRGIQLRTKGNAKKLVNCQREIDLMKKANHLLHYLQQIKMQRRH